jgi:hypothetical protein
VISHAILAREEVWSTRAATSYCQYVIVVVGLAGALLLMITGLVWTARLVHVGNLDALALAEKIGTPQPASALDWPELRLRAVVPQPGEPSLVLLFAEWPAHPDRTATMLVRLDGGGQPLLSRWCADRASISPVRRGDGLELRRRQSLERVRGFLVAEDALRLPREGPRPRPGATGQQTGRG